MTSENTAELVLEEKDKIRSPTETSEISLEMPDSSVTRSEPAKQELLSSEEPQVIILESPIGTVSSMSSSAAGREQRPTEKPDVTAVPEHVVPA